MAIVKWIDSKLTDHFSLDEYTVNQSEKASCPLTRAAYEHAMMLEEFRVWYNAPIKVNAWFRTEAYNNKVSTCKTSNHLTGCATDLGIATTSTGFIKIARKWKEICEKHNTVGEAGYYANGWIHLGSHITYSKSFYNWFTNTKGTQSNNYFKI